MNKNSGASKSVTVSAPAALGAPPLIDVLASNLPSVSLTQSRATHPGLWSSFSQVRSTPRVVLTPGNPVVSTLHSFGDPRFAASTEYDCFSGRASFRPQPLEVEPTLDAASVRATRGRSNLRVHESSGRASMPLLELLPYHQILVCLTRCGAPPRYG